MRPWWRTPTSPSATASSRGSRRASPRAAPRRSSTRKNRLAFPGLVDPHMHTGIYSPLAEDAVTESRAAAQGGVTSSLNYMRTGGYYLNKGGPYKKFFPEVLDISAGKFHVDYAYHLAPMSKRHIREIPMLVERLRRHLLQDLHVLRRPRPARPLAEPGRVPDDRQGREVRHRPLRVRHARHPQGAWSKYPDKADDISPQPALRDRRDHVGLHEDGGGGGHAEGPARLQRRRARPTPRAWRSSSRPTSPTRPTCRTSTCCT